jgi:hypothetical protein
MSVVLINSFRFGAAGGVTPGGALLVVNNTASLTSGEQSLQTRLAGLGYTVTTRAATSAEPADMTPYTPANGGFVAVTSDITSGDLGTKYKTHTGGLLLMEGFAWDEHGYCTSQTGYTDEQTYDLVGSHAVLGGLSAGNYQFTDYLGAESIMTATGLCAGATVFAERTTGTEPVGFTIESGGALTSGNAAGKRIGFGVGAGVIAGARANFWTVFDASVTWLTGASGGGTPPPPPPSGSRLAWKHPYIPESHFNMPIGSNATWSGNDAAAQQIQSSAYINVNNGWSYTVYLATGSDPIAWCNDYGDGSGSRNAYVPTNIEIPLGTGPGGYDRPVVVVQPNGWECVTLYGANKVSDTWYDCYRVEDVDLRTDGVAGCGSIGSQADGLGALGGLVRRDEVMNRYIPHTLAIAPSPYYLQVGPVWPACADDGDYSETPGGLNRMGYLYAIPPWVDVNTLGLNADALAWAKAAQDYGCYIRDEGGNGATFLAEQSQSGWSDKATYDARTNAAIAQIGIIASYLQRVTNNTSSSVGGGGTPRVALAPPL